MLKIVATLLCFVSVPALALDFPRRDGGTSGAIALRGGYGLPFGEAIKGLDLEDLYTGSAPAWLEVGARSEHTFLGFYFQYASAFVKDCPAGLACSGYSMRAGAEVLYSFFPAAPLSPWAGVGIGWEGAKLEKGPDETKVNAFEFANVQLGVEVRAIRTLTIGPYVTASFARFSDDDGEKIEEQATHAWLQAGLRCEVRF